jgi:hypothetical protein
MIEDQINTNEPHLSWTEHAAVLLGGAIGGWLGLAFVALLMVPNVYSVFRPDSLLCCGFGLMTGYLPGIGVCLVAIQRIERKSARQAGFIVATATAALISGFVAAFFAAAAQC